MASSEVVANVQDEVREANRLLWMAIEELREQNSILSEIAVALKEGIPGHPAEADPQPVEDTEPSGRDIDPAAG